MDYFAEQIEEFPSLSYIALVGAMSEDFDEELTRRVRRIREASPEKSKLALDVRGLNRLEPEHYELFANLKQNLEEMDWEIFICNVPSRFDNFFQSGRVQREFEVFPSKQELLKELASENGQSTEQQTETSVRPIPVLLRTTEGIRLFEGSATTLTTTGILKVFTDDHNASSIDGDSDREYQLYFNSNILQMPPPIIEIKTCEELNSSNANYQLELKLQKLDNQQRTLLEEYFGTSFSQPA